MLAGHACKSYATQLYLFSGQLSAFVWRVVAAHFTYEFLRHPMAINIACVIATARCDIVLIVLIVLRR